ncbi:hypothetical protein CPC08DRAFT_392110 [Agrocybe pediades]|nr:hypothetical protein CPC08DRAFT_392110 [Agrocybe pediades]
MRPRLTLSPHATFRERLSSTSSAPPRRKSTNGSAFLPAASSSSFSASKTSVPNANFLESPTVSDANTSLTAALSEMTRTSAVLAGTAFVIATSLVGLLAYGVVWGTKTGFGVDDARQFGSRMRSVLSMTTPSHASSIDHPNDAVDEIRPTTRVS